MTKPEKSSQEEKKTDENEPSQDLKKSTLTDYLPNIWGRKKQENEQDQNGSVNTEESKVQKGDQAAQQAMKEAEEQNNLRKKKHEMMKSFGMDHFRPEGQRPTIDEHGNLPAVFLEEVPTTLRSHP